MLSLPDSNTAPAAAVMIEPSLVHGQVAAAGAFFDHVYRRLPVDQVPRVPDRTARRTGIVMNEVVIAAHPNRADIRDVPGNNDWIFVVAVAEVPRGLPLHIVSHGRKPAASGKGTAG